MSKNVRYPKNLSLDEPGKLDVAADVVAEVGLCRLDPASLVDRRRMAETASCYTEVERTEGREREEICKACYALYSYAKYSVVVAIWNERLQQHNIHDLPPSHGPRSTKTYACYLPRLLRVFVYYFFPVRKALWALVAVIWFCRCHTHLGVPRGDDDDDGFRLSISSSDGDASREFTFLRSFPCTAVAMTPMNSE